MAGGKASARRVPALVVSALLHAGLAVLLGHFLRPGPAPPEPRVVQVTLVTPARREAPPRTPRDERRRVAPRPPVANADADVAPLPLAPAPQAAAGEPGQGQRVLRGLAGCERAGLTREERERCETRRWAKVGAG